MFRVFEETVRPAVGGVWAKVRAARRNGGGGVGWRSWGWFCCWGRVGVVDGGVGAMIACAAGGDSAVAAVLVGITEMATEVGEGFVGIVFVAPLPTSNVEEAGGIDNVVADADDGGVTWSIVAGGSEAYAGVELGE